jgi:hypothetical protein
MSDDNENIKHTTQKSIFGGPFRPNPKTESPDPNDTKEQARAKEEKGKIQSKAKKIEGILHSINVYKAWINEGNFTLMEHTELNGTVKLNLSTRRDRCAASYWSHSPTSSAMKRTGIILMISLRV